jgi:hypothetical protein
MKRNYVMRKSYCIVLLLLFVCNNAYAGNWYVDNAVVSSGNGQSWSTAWKNFSNIVWGNTGVKAGDTLFISGGSTSKSYYETLNIGASGSPGAPITIKVDINNNSHSGSVKIDCNGENRSSGINTNGKNYITISGIDSAYRIKVSSCTNSIDRWRSDAITDGGNGALGNIFEYVEVTGCNNGIRQANNGVEIRYCYLHDIRGDAALKILGSEGSSWGLNKIHHNTIQVNLASSAGADGPDGIQGSGSIDFYNNYLYSLVGTVCSGQHPDGIQATGKYWRIYNNLIENIGDAAIDNDNYLVSTLAHFHVYNNVIRITDSAFRSKPGGAWPMAMRVYASGGRTITSIDDYVIANNTIVDYSTYQNVTAVAINGNANPTVANSYIKNNIFYNCGWQGTTGALAINGVSVSDWNIDYNIIYAGAHGTSILKFNSMDYGPHGCSGCTEWGGVVQSHGSSNKPAFVNYSEDSISNNFRLTSEDITARDQGTALSFTTGNTDMLGVVRPQGSAWDIGAYEYRDRYLGAPINFRKLGP